MAVNVVVIVGAISSVGVTVNIGVDVKAGVSLAVTIGIILTFKIGFMTFIGNNVGVAVGNINLMFGLILLIGDRVTASTLLANNTLPQTNPKNTLVSFITKDYTPTCQLSQKRR